MLPASSLSTPAGFSIPTKEEIAKVKSKPLFRNERFYVDAAGPERGRLEAYIKFNAGGRIVERSQAKFIIISCRADLARTYAEGAPREEGEKMIGFDWIKESVEKGQIVSREPFWAIPRAVLGNVSASSMDQGAQKGYTETEQKSNSNQGHSSSRDWHPDQEPGYQYRVDGSEEIRSQLAEASTDKKQSQLAYGMNRRDEGKSLRSRYRGERSDIDQSMSSHDNPLHSNASKFDRLSARDGIFNNLRFWVVGSPKQRERLENLIMSEGGILTVQLESANRILFYPPSVRFLGKTEFCLMRAEALYNEGVRCLAYQWAEDCLFSAGLLDERYYMVGMRDLCDNRFWNRMVDQSPPPPPPRLSLPSSSPAHPPPSMTRPEIVLCQSPPPPPISPPLLPPPRNEVGIPSQNKKEWTKPPTKAPPGGAANEERMATLLQQLTSKVDKALAVARDSTGSTYPSLNTQSTDGDIPEPASLTSFANDHYPTPISPISTDYPYDTNYTSLSHSGEGPLVEFQRARSHYDRVPPASSVPPRHGTIFRGLTFWVIGPPIAREKLRTKIRNLGGDLGNSLDGSSRIIFCRCPTRYRINERVTLFEHAKRNHLLLLGESWVHDVYRAAELLDHKNYKIQSKAVLEDIDLWDRMLPWSRLNMDKSDLAHSERNDKRDIWTTQEDQSLNTHHLDGKPLGGRYEELSNYTSQDKQFKLDFRPRDLNAETTVNGRVPKSSQSLRSSISRSEKGRSIAPLESRTRCPSPLTQDQTGSATPKMTEQKDVRSDINYQQADGEYESDDFADLARIFSTDEEDGGNEKEDKEESDLTPVTKSKSKAWPTDRANSPVRFPISRDILHAISLSFYNYHNKTFRKDLPDLPWSNRRKEDST